MELPDVKRRKTDEQPAQAPSSSADTLATQVDVHEEGGLDSPSSDWSGTALQMQGFDPDQPVEENDRLKALLTGPCNRADDVDSDDSDREWLISSGRRWPDRVVASAQPDVCDDRE